MKETALHQTLIDTYGIRVHKLPQELANFITTYRNLHDLYKAQWKDRHDFIDYKNLTDEKVERVRLFLDKKRQFKDGNKSFSQMLSATAFVGKGMEGDKHILYMDDSRGYPVPEYIYHALLSVRPSSTADSTDYASMFRQADGQITQELTSFLRFRSKTLDYYLSDTGSPPSDSQDGSKQLKGSLYEWLIQLTPSLLESPICQQYQTKFNNGRAYQISCISKSGETSYFDLTILKLNSNSLIPRKTHAYTFYIRQSTLQPILGIHYDHQSKAQKDMEVIQLMGGKAKDLQIETGLLKEIEKLLVHILKKKLVFDPLPSAIELLLKQLDLVNGKK